MTNNQKKEKYIGWRKTFIDKGLWEHITWSKTINNIQQRKDYFPLKSFLLTPHTTWSIIWLTFFLLQIYKRNCLDSLSPKSLLLSSLEPEPVRPAPITSLKLHWSRSPRKFLFPNIIILSHTIWPIRAFDTGDHSLFTKIHFSLGLQDTNFT